MGFGCWGLWWRRWWGGFRYYVLFSNFFFLCLERFGWSTVLDRMALCFLYSYGLNLRIAQQCLYPSYTLDLNLQSFFFRSWIAYLPLRLVAEMFPFMWFSLYVILLDSWPFVRLHLFWASMMVGDDIMFIPFRCL